MIDQLSWYVARASGIVAWALAAGAVVWGLLLSGRRLRERPGPRRLLDLHRYLGGLAVVFTGVHLAALVVDSYVAFGLTDLFVPFASAWNPAAVAWGVVAVYLLVAVEVTSLLRSRIPTRWWRGVHLSSYGLFTLATVHALTAGTDAGNLVFQVAVDATVGVVVVLTVARVLRLRRRTTTRPPARRSATSPRAAAEPVRARSFTSA